MLLLNSGAALVAGSVEDFVQMAPASSLTARLVHEFNRRWGTAPETEITAWRQSLTALARVVEATDLPRAGVGVEVKLPFTDRRIDASFVARDRTGVPHVVVVELKQWEAADPSQFPDTVMVGGREMVHPSVQAASYAAYLKKSHSAFTEQQFSLSACAYLHNLPAHRGSAIGQVPLTDLGRDAPLFARGNEPDLQALLQNSLMGGDGLALLPSLVEGRYSPSKELIQSIAQSLQGSPVWTLLDEQRLAFNVVRGLVETTARTGEKAVVCIVGGPGTGKSVIAVHLLVALPQDHGYRVCHATGSKAFTTNLRAISPPGGSAVFRYFNNFRHKQTKPNSLDVLICDEAHRIRETSNERYTPRKLRSEISQVRELIRAARVTVFLLDERQNVRPGEIGTIAAVEEGAHEERVQVRRIDLTGQFRCNGCWPYLRWVDAVMSDQPETVGGWLTAGEYDLRVYDSPEDLETAVHQQVAKGHTGRLVAGFCWPWSDPLSDGSLVKDVTVGRWPRPWNEKPPEQRNPPRPAPPPHRHPYYQWATQPKGLDEVGCIYSSQGFEFEYCGVILGDDLVWRGGAVWVAQKERSRDPALRRRRLTPVALKALLQHTYRVLLTRGIKGTFVYSTDPETLGLLHSLVRNKKS